MALIGVDLLIPSIEVTTGFFAGSGPPGPVGRRSSCSSDAYREWIELELSRGRNATGIFQDLVDQHGFTGSYESVKRFVRKLRGPVSPEARAIIETRPGEDYGEFRVMVRRGGDLRASEENLRRGRFSHNIISLQRFEPVQEA